MCSVDIFEEFGTGTGRMDTESPVIWPAWCYTGDPTTNGESDSPVLKPRKRRLGDKMNGTTGSSLSEYTNNNNPATGNQNTSPGAVKSERLSPGTPDTLSRSRSVTPSSASYPGTPPAAPEPLLHHSTLPHPALASRNYSDFMRSLAAKYNNANPNDYFGGVIRNGYNLLKPTTSLPNDHPPQPNPTLSPSTKSKPPSSNNDMTLAAAAALLNPFSVPTPYSPLIDMSSTHALLAMVRSAKEAEVQNLLKAAGGKRPPEQTPLDLSAAAAAFQVKRPRVKTPSSGKNSDSESPRPHHHQEGLGDITTWTVEDVCSFVGSIDICAEYVQKFREQRIDGAGLPLLTEEHLTNTMGLKLGPALKLRSLLARKTGSCSVCLHCVHCHTPPPGDHGTSSSEGISTAT